MVTATDKLVTANKASGLEKEVAACLAEMQNNPDCNIKGELAHVQLIKATEVPVGATETASKVVVLSFPPRSYTDFVRKSHVKFVGELEKKLRRPVLLTAHRTPIPKERSDLIGLRRRPYSRSLTYCREALLADLVAPAEIVGKRLRVRTDGTRLLKIFLDPRCKELLEEKLECFAAAYKKLARVDAVFTFGDSL